MKKNIVILLLALISISLVGYIVYGKMNEDKIVNDNDTNNNFNEDSYGIEDFTSVINKELGFLVSKENFIDLTEEEKTRMLFDLSDKEEMTTEKLENIRINSSLREIDVEYTDIYNRYNGYELDDDVFMTLDVETGEYSNPLTGHGASLISFRSFLQDYKVEDGRYIITYKYVFIKKQGDGPSNLDLYYFYEDAINDENKVKEFLLEDVDNNELLLSNQVDSYVSANYRNFKDELNVYTYEFEIHDENIVLIDFYRY